MPVVMKSHSPLSVLSSFNPAVPSTPYHLCKNANRILLKKLLFPQNLGFCGNYSIWKASHVSFCYAKDKDISEGFPEIEKLADSEELELLDKPSPMPVNGDTDTLENEPKRPDKNAALEPFLKFFRTTDMEEEVEPAEQVVAKLEEESDKVIVEYYEPKPGDFVVGVVVSGNENKLDVNIGADLLGTMLTKEVLPLYDKEMDYMLRDLDKNADDFIANGKMGIVRNEDALSGQPVSGRPVVDAGTVLFAEVLGRTLSGRPLLSTRRYFRRIAWHRVRQMKHLGEPIEVRITEWNTGGLLTRVEGLRAFLPKIELVDRVNSFTELKEKVKYNLLTFGKWKYVIINVFNLSSATLCGVC
ncbi:30S ribosomal protein S1 [Bienertia sinuspersici]